MQGRWRRLREILEEVVTMTPSEMIALIALVLAAIRLGMDIRK